MLRIPPARTRWRLRTKSRNAGLKLADSTHVPAGIRFRCGRCARDVQATADQAGQVVVCPGCQHRNLCPTPGETTSRVGARRPASSPESGSSARTILRAIGVVVLVALLWIAWSRLADRDASARAPESATAADARQHELLRKNLDRPGDPALAAMYDEINARHFDGALPSMPVVWEPELTTVGELSGREFSLEGMFGFVDTRALILLTPQLQTDRRALERVLCHEMVHAYLHTLGDSTGEHGPTFQTVLRRLSAEGAFEGLVATDEDRAQLRGWLDAEQARLDAEAEALDALDARLQSERLEVESARADPAGRSNPQHAALVASLRDAYNRRAAEATSRVEQLRRDRAVLNREIARYNLMLVYPDGVDDEPPS